MYNKNTSGKVQYVPRRKRIGISAAGNVVDPDPHHFSNLDPDPHQIKIQIRTK
jgi:hypothetical protein